MVNVMEREKRLAISNLGRSLVSGRNLFIYPAMQTSYLNLYDSEDVEYAQREAQMSADERTEVEFETFSTQW
jgi:hypothetical protein